MIYFMLSPERLETSASTMSLKKGNYSRVWSNSALEDDDSNQYRVSQGGGIHKIYFAEFITRIAKRFGQGMRRQCIVRLNDLCYDIYPSFLENRLHDFVDSHYNSWREKIINSAEYAQMDIDIHVELCASCVLVDCCDRDCDMLNRERDRFFMEVMDEKVLLLEALFNKFWAARSGHLLPELQHEYEPLGS
jgi:hypothetical protein